LNIAVVSVDALALLSLLASSIWHPWALPCILGQLPEKFLGQLPEKRRHSVGTPKRPFDRSRKLECIFE
jgi:hypothetical protein